MGKYQEEKKTPIIMVKKRRTLLPPSLSEKTGVIARSETVKMEDPVSVGSSSPAVDTHPPEASASKKKKKRRRFPRQPHWTHEFTHNCVEKVKSLFPHLRAESGGFLPLKIGITNDFAAFLTEHPETELTLDEWSCAISCITTRQVYLLRTAVAGIPRYGLDGLPAGQVSECDAQNARRWLAVREKQKLKMKTMQEQTASTEKIER
ncbi:ProQ/FINO family protein [Escherichia coli]|uniref:ProQ/FINO family protein n=1 Tax=Escherichia coli TaxID=562 RepID=UPI001E486D64|nr:ProQ/FINO family protein [Escherichia coli]UEO27576.1 ProQ/FINO family protein [Escherichia coli]